MEISEELREVRRIFDSGYAGRAKLREMGYSINLDGKVWSKGTYIGSV